MEIVALKLAASIVPDHFLSTEARRYNSLASRFVHKSNRQVWGGFMKHSMWLAVCAWAFVLIWATPGAIAADNEKVAAELKTIIDSGEPSIGNEDNDERIVEVYVFYAADRDYKPIWVRDNGPKAKRGAGGFQGRRRNGSQPRQLSRRRDRKAHECDPPRACRVGAAAEPRLHRFRPRHQPGRVVPSRASAENAIVAKELGALTLIDGAEVTDSIAEFVDTLEPQTREYRRLKSALAYIAILKQKGGWPMVPKGPALKPGIDERVFRPCARLQVTRRSCASAAADSDAYDAALVEAVKRSRPVTASPMTASSPRPRLNR